MKACRMIAAAGLAVGVWGAGALLAGDLDPPSGAISPTMKSLDSVRPGVCANDLPGSATAVHVITQPGVYFLRAPIDGQAGKHGILIDLSALPPGAHEVTIDLSGFPLRGVTGSLDGLHSSSFEGGRYVLRAGVPLRFDTVGMRGFGGDGLHIEGASSVSIDGVRFDQNDGDGFEVQFGAGGQPTTLSCTGVVATASGASGAKVGIGVDTPNATLKFDGCVSSGNADEGVVVEWRQAAGPGARRASMDMRSCELTGNGSHGALFDSSRRQSADQSVDMEDCSASGNGGSGVACIESTGRSSYSFEGCSFSDNIVHGADLRGGAQVPDLLRMSACTASTNGQHGFVNASPEGLFDSCVATGNGGDGFRDLVNALVPRNTLKSFRNCSSSDNTGNGFSAVRAQGSVNDGNNLNWHFGRAAGNGGHGWFLDDMEVVLESCASTTNGGDGVKYQTMSPGHKYIDTLNLRSSGNLGSGLSCTGGELELEDCILEDNGYGPAGGDGLRCAGVTKISAITMRIPKNALHGASLTNSGHISIVGGAARSNGGGGGGGGGGGLFIEGASSVEIDGFSCASNLGSSIIVADCPNNRLQRVSCVGGGGSGIVVESTGGLPCGVVSLVDCSVTAHAGDGYSVTCSTGGEVRGCLSSHNGGVGFSLSGLGHVVTGNSSVGDLGGSFIVPMPGNSLGPLTDEAGMATAVHGANFVR